MYILDVDIEGMKKVHKQFEEQYGKGVAWIIKCDVTSQKEFEGTHNTPVVLTIHLYLQYTSCIYNTPVVLTIHQLYLQYTSSTYNTPVVFTIHQLYLQYTPVVLQK